MGWDLAIIEHEVERCSLHYSWRASSMRGEEAGHFHEVVGNGLSIVAVGCLHSVVDTLGEAN